MIGTLPRAFAGVCTVNAISGALSASPIRPTIRRRTAAPSRAASSVSVTRHCTFGVRSGMRP
jgi:hypothetical protein